MSFTDVFDYFSARAKELNYKLHKEGFIVDNLASTLVNKSFHIAADSFSGLGQNQMDLRIETPVTVRLYFKGNKDELETKRIATIGGEAFIEACLASENRLTQTKIKNVRFNGMFLEPYAPSNDRSIVCRIEFVTSIFKGIC